MYTKESIQNIDLEFHFENVEKVIHARSTERDRENARISLSVIRRALKVAMEPEAK